MTKKEEEREDGPGSSPENQDPENEGAPVEGDEPADEGKEEGANEEGADQDIDFDEELARLEGGGEGAPPAEQPPKAKTEEEKAGYTIRETIKRLKKKGLTDAQISKHVGFKVTTTEDDEPEPEEEPAREGEERAYVTRDELDLREADRRARELARSEGERKVIMWYVKNKKLSVEEAHFLANRRRTIRNTEEIARSGEARPGAPAAAGRRTDAPVAKHRFTREEMEQMRRRGMTWNPETKQMEGKFTFIRIDDKTGERVTGRLTAKKK